MVVCRHRRLRGSCARGASNRGVETEPWVEPSLWATTIGGAVIAVVAFLAQAAMNKDRRRLCDDIVDEMDTLESSDVPAGGP